MTRIEQMDFRILHIAPSSVRLRDIEGEIVLTPDDE